MGPLLAWICTLVPLIAWSAAAIWFDGPPQRWLAGLLAGGLVLVAGGALAFLRPVRRALIVVLVAFIAVLGWWLNIPASNEGDWQPDVARTASASIDGNIVTIRNVRNFDWRSETDYTPRWETRRYDLSQLRGADMFLSYWGPRVIAHTIMSWEFADGQHLAISIETRKKVGQSYSAVLGFFRQYEIYYVVADERDLIGVRAMYRGEDLYLYRLKNPPAQARAVLLDYLKEVNRLDSQPEWYNALVHNCTTTIRHHARERRGRPAVRLAHPRQRLHRRAGLRARPDRHQPALRRAAPAQRHHGQGEGRLRRRRRFFTQHPRRTSRRAHAP